ncbi:general secretion pathway protein GspC [Photobacterium kishitanii]|uniref:Type II secretion system protein GspC n=1 Tax=Photobacterium kishitanii TaxID=318456 RepID=A0AAX0YSH5_9GAMM|nr:type II secretion system protein GspC [Photobacterium kishitanii]KJG09016.1 general secretion pathway protein GspC [Photobacterium kishitanii]KJG56135.1 general secretion pathway protein GspC [Photobacterium kishitanii]KJG59501.1 general secretion pathway protein GspC [Photobacterium kishitanii]KJG64269.1 general secretion pathway protein GspC [Photobacterium kishitanii]KJG68360.1 general secretion pathway protein GspC [Photobacterium kishitanii]
MFASKWFAAAATKRPLSLQSVTRILTCLLVVIFAWVAGRLVWSIVEPAPAVARWQPLIVSVNTSQQQLPVNEILSLNLFGRYQANAAPVAVKPVKQDAPQTQLRLTLVGVVASSTPSKALAVVTNNGKQNTYGINEVIDNTRATLIAVYNDRVIIRNNGRDETLMLEGLKFTKPSVAPVSSQRNTSPSNSNAAELAKIKQEILSEPQTLFSYIRLSQVKKDGQIEGYRVNPGKNRILFDQVGLKANDLAVSINGNSLTDPAIMAKLWGELSSASDFTLTVERDGQLHDIHIELQ